MQRGTGVAHAIREPLTPVDVAEGDVVRSVEMGERDDVQSALLDVALEVRGGIDARGEAVRDRDRPPAPRRGIRPHDLHRAAERLLLRAHPRPDGPDEGRLEEGDAVEVDGAVGVVDRDGRAHGRRIRQHVDALAQEPGLEAQPRGGVVVAARDDDASPGVAQTDERVGEERVAVGRGGRGVEHVARDDDDVDRVLAHLCDERLEHAAQRRQGRVAVERPPDVPVRGVHDPHATTVGITADIASEAGREAVRRPRWALRKRPTQEAAATGVP